MGCCTDNRVKVHPRPQRNQFVRLNGWTQPIHYLQVVAWVILVIFALVYFGVVAIAVANPWKPAAYVCVGILYLLHCVIHLIALTINPADANARERIKEQHEVPEFDRSKHAHVIENEYCHLCETYVSKKSKHCRACNKCVQDFDHHCLWLNNCVGRRNYKYFLATILTAFLGVLIIVTVSLFVFINALMGFQNLDPYIWWNQNGMPWVLFETFIGITILLGIISLFLLGQLLFFHILLIRRGITTYEYIQNGRAKNEKKFNKVDSTSQAAVHNDNDACAAPDFIETDVTNKASIKVANGIAANGGKDVTPVPATSPQLIKRMSPDKSLSPNSEFTNHAFANDELRNNNINSNVTDVRESMGDYSSQNVSRISLTGSENESPMKKHRLSISQHTTDGEDILQVSTEKRKPKRKRPTRIIRESPSPRPLPVPPENLTPVMRGGPTQRPGSALLPPLRTSADWERSSENLQSAIPRNRLPPLHAST